jgi:hypothetical protein
MPLSIRFHCPLLRHPRIFLSIPGKRQNAKPITCKSRDSEVIQKQMLELKTERRLYDDAVV